MFQRVRQWPMLYLKALREKPIRTNVLSGAIVMLLGDGIAQKIEQHHHYHHHQQQQHLVWHEKDNNDPSSSSSSSSLSFWDSYDPLRTAVMVSWSAVGDVPINLALFRMVETLALRLGIPASASISQSLFKAICFFIPSTIIRIPFFLAYITTMEHVGRTNWQQQQSHGSSTTTTTTTTTELLYDKIWYKIQTELSTIIYNGAHLWIPMNTLFFFQVPMEFRTLCRSVVSVGWMAYLSLVQHKKPQQQQEQQEQPTTTTISSTTTTTTAAAAAAAAVVVTAKVSNLKEKEEEEESARSRMMSSTSTSTTPPTTTTTSPTMERQRREECQSSRRESILALDPR
jgi:hypothetical protein